MSKSENVALYKYLTRPVNESVKQSHRYNQARSTLEQQEKIKEIYSKQLPKNTNFDFKTFKVSIW